MILIRSLLGSLMRFCSLGRPLYLYIPRLRVGGLDLFTMVAKYLLPISAVQCQVRTLLTLSVMAVVILKAREYTKADRYGSEKYI